MFYYRGEQLYAVRQGPYKLHFTTQSGYGDKPHKHDPPALYNLEHDPSEKYDIAKDHPDVVAELTKLAEAHKQAMVPGKPQLIERIKE